VANSFGGSSEEPLKSQVRNHWLGSTTGGQLPLRRRGLQTLLVRVSHCFNQHRPREAGNNAHRLQPLWRGLIFVQHQRFITRTVEILQQLWRVAADVLGGGSQLRDWFERRREKASLIVMIDDATNWMFARFFEEEITSAIMESFWKYVIKYGLPRSLYVDKDSIYNVNRDATTDENLKETGPLTQFARALRQLDVKLILAHSPQAKGRVERRHGVLQDRLVKALRVYPRSRLKLQLGT